eukprot:scaffold2523_cov366-Prasinococcus_capsulatus_cf.AAC.6
MGQGTSKAMLATHEQLLKQLVGVAKTGAAEPFWEELLTFPVPLCKLAPADVEAFVFPFCEDLGAPIVASNRVRGYVLCSGSELLRAGAGAACSLEQ